MRKAKTAHIRLYRVLENDEWVMRSLPTWALCSGFRDADKQMMFDGDILREETKPAKSNDNEPFVRHWLVCWDDFANRWIARHGSIERDLTDHRVREMKIVGDIIRHKALLEV
jgi:hypothetical protein